MITNFPNHAVEQQVEDPKTELIGSSSLRKRFQKFMCGWGALVSAGMLSLTFLLCISLIPNTSLYPVYKDLYANMVPLIQQGNVRVYPRQLDPSAISWGNDTYFITLPPSDLSSTIEPLINIIKSYPQNEGNVYRQCWLQNPSYEHPCFFDNEWISRECTESNHFGYREVNGTFSPCVILRIEDTGTWSPVPDIHFSHDLTSGPDPGFISENCYLQNPSDSQKFKSIVITPQKGFSRMYFPISTFDPKRYLYPIVTLQVQQLKKGQNVTIICQLGAQNAFYLQDDGLVTITFGS